MSSQSIILLRHSLVACICAAAMQYSYAENVTSFESALAKYKVTRLKTSRGNKFSKYLN